MLFRWSQIFISLGYDVNNDDRNYFIDAGIVQVHRTTNALYDGLYDVNQDGKVNFVDAGKTWVNGDQKDQRIEE